MKYDKKYIDAICKKYNITNYTINEDRTIDVDGNVNLYDIGITDIPLKFGRVTGDFICSKNKLKSLLNSPNYVGETFNCMDNELTTLEHSPKYVGESFWCGGNKLKSLKYLPEFIGEDLWIFDNKLESLEYSPEVINGDFICSDNELKTLEYSPKRVTGDFNYHSINITNFKGISKYVGGKIFAHFNYITNLEILPSNFSELDLNYVAPIKDILQLFTNGEKLKEINYLLYDFIDREIIQNDNILSIDRLIEFLDDLGKTVDKQELIKKLKKNYTIV